MSNISKLDFEGKVLCVKAKHHKAQYRHPHQLLFFCETGFGCNPNLRGSAIFGVYLSDGEQTRKDRDDFDKVADQQWQKLESETKEEFLIRVQNLMKG